MDVIAKAGRGWIRAACALVAVLGLSFVVSGTLQGRMWLVSGGVMFVVVAVAAGLHVLAMRPGIEGATPCAAEKSAWHMAGIGLTAMLVLGALPLHGEAASWLLFGTYTLWIVFLPAFRRRFVEHYRGWREVHADERDREIRARGDHLARRMLELSLTGLATTWALWPQVFQSLSALLHVGALLLFPVLLANVTGEARVAWLYWRDRQ